MTYTLLIGSPISRNRFLNHFSTKFFTDNPLEFFGDLAISKEYYFYGISYFRTMILTQFDCVIKIFDNDEGSYGGQTTDGLFSKPTYQLSLNDIQNDNTLELIKIWIDEQSSSAKDFQQNIPDKNLFALVRDEHNGRSDINFIENSEFRLIQQSFIRLSIEQKCNMINVAKVYDILSFPVFQKFYQDIKNPTHRHSANLTDQQFHSIIKIFHIVVKWIMKDFYYKKVWKSYGRYCSKSGYFMLPGMHISVISEIKKSFLIFTKKSEPFVFYILIKSNIHISDASQTPEKDVLWAYGSTKKIKLRAMLLKFRLDYPNIIPDPVCPIRRVVTFASPTTIAPPTIPLTKVQRIQQKSIEIEKILTDQRNYQEFSHWDGVLSFHFGPTIGRKILAYQSFAGHSFDHEYSILQSLSLDQKLYAILSLFTHFKEIICTQNTWPSDIKLRNLVYNESEIHPRYYSLRLIDFESRASTYTFLKAKQSGYLHQICQSITLSNYKDYCRQLDMIISSADHTIENNNQKFKLITYHCCFELILCIFLIMNNLAGKRFFTVDQPWIQEADLADTINKHVNQDHVFSQSATDMPFFDILVKHVYHQNFLRDDTKTVFDVLKQFFEDIRSEIIKKIEPGFIFISRISPLIAPLSSDHNHILSNAWIDTVCTEFQSIKDKSRLSGKIEIEHLEHIFGR